MASPPIVPCGFLQFDNVVQLIEKYFAKEISEPSMLLRRSASRANLCINRPQALTSQSTSNLHVATSEGIPAASNKSEQELPFLQRVVCASLPTFDIVAFAFGKKIVIANVDDTIKHSMDTSVTIVLEHPVSTMAIWPIVPSRSSDPRPYEWSAIVIGLRNGQVFCYTDRGFLLTSLQYSEKSVIDIRIESGELTIVYEDCFVIINGLTLLASLKLQRQKVARGVDIHQGLVTGGADEEQIQWKKYTAENVRSPSTVVPTGVYKQTIWEQMVAASTRGGVNATVHGSGRAPYDTYCALGDCFSDNAQSSFVSFNWHAETPPSHTDLVRELVSGLKKNLIPSFLSSSRKNVQLENMSAEIQAEQLKAALGQKPADIFQRSALVDVGRQGQKIIISPGNAHLALVCDSNGRVLLIDVRQRVITRVWKGYRDAQCAWLEIFGHEKTVVASGPLTNLRTKGEQRLVKRNALCAVIYAPKRGILEVWSTQNGMRVAACNVDKEGVLLYCPRTNIIMPANHVELRNPIRFMDSNLNIYALDTVSLTADGRTVVSSTISFERAVEKRSIRSYWSIETRENFLHFLSDQVKFSSSDQRLEKLRYYAESMKSWRDCRYFLDECLKCDWLTYQDSSKVCQFLIEICQQCFSNRRLIAVKTPQIPSDAETSHFYSYCLVVRQVIDLYANVLKNYSQEAELVNYSSNQFHDPETVSEELTKNLHVEETELHGLCDNLQENLLLRDFIRGKMSKADQSWSKQVVKLSKFVKCFDLETGASSASRFICTDSDNATTLPAYFMQSLTSKQVDDLGRFFFQQFLKQSPDTDFYRNIQSISGVNARSWLELLCDFWLQVRRPYPVHPTTLLKLCRSMLSNCKEFKNCLHKTREKLLNSREMAECLSLCLVLRALAKSYHESAADSTDKSGLSSSSVENAEISEDSWEKIDMDVEGWDSLLKIFHARLLTETFIYRLVDACRSKKSKKLAHKSKNPLQTVAQISNLNTVLTGGIGFVVEEISKYIVENCSFIDANFIIELFRLRQEFGENEEKFVCNEYFLFHDEKLLNALFLMKQFYSSPTLDACSLAASCSWQHIRRWNPDPSHFPDSLRSALDFSIQIRDCRTRHGLRTLIWHKFLLERMRSLCIALNKSRFTDGHIRRDRVCRNDMTNLHLDLKRFESQSGVIGFQNINDFSSIMVHFFKNLFDDLDEIERSSRESEITFDKDTRWKSESTEKTSNQHNQTYDDYLLEFFNIFTANSKIAANSLTEIANSQQTCNKRRVALNYQLSMVTFFSVQHHANLSEIAPYNLFEEEEEELFFENLQKACVDNSSTDHYHQLSSAKELVDVRLQNKRLSFLKSCLCACVPQSLERKFSDTKSNDGDWFWSGGSRPLIYRLCQFWQLDSDELRRFEVLVLYAENRAQDAISLAPLIANSHQMAQELFDVVCDSIKSRYNSVNLRTLISPSLRFHLNLDSGDSPIDKQAARKNKDKGKYDPPPITATNTCEQATKAAIGFARGDAQLSRLARDLYDLVDSLLTQRNAKKK